MAAIRKRRPPREAGRRLRRGISKEEVDEGRIPGRDVIVAMEKIMVPIN